MNESVWDYPRPPRVEPSERRVRVQFGGQVVAESRRALRVLETSHPPGWYIPAEDTVQACLVRTTKTTWCEFKGVAGYWDVVVDNRIAPAAAWSYADPTPGFEAIKDHVAFYPSLMDACWVDDDLVEAQAGGFYGGWITPEISGPFKG